MIDGTNRLDPANTVLRKGIGVSVHRWKTRSVRLDACSRPISRGQELVSGSSTQRSPQMPPIDLSAEYLKNAGAVAHIRARYAAHRMAAVWREALR